MKIIIEGVDNLGKGTLINGLKNKLGYFEVVHFQKPQVLEKYSDAHDPLKAYQEASFRNGFELLRSNANLIFDRFHLGEIVYGRRYRGYNGDYVLGIEAEYLDVIQKQNVFLFLLTTSNFDFIPDDKLSFDVTKQFDEQLEFYNAFNCSNVQNKFIIDVHNGNGNFKSKDVILHEVLIKL